ncbi:MAG TPA: O-antigen ligase family protein [Candidatus Limnocylindrales bacterium]|nr:O-antigen ligase family protein [Candidatus Limnocylindrales bacterium]
MTEPSQFGSFPGYEGVLVPEPVRSYSPVQGRTTGRSLRLRSKPRFSLAGRFARLFAGIEQLSTLGKIAFGSLWLLVFTMPWEDAITIPGFGTSVRLIGMVTCGLGALAILERGRVRKPAIGHVVMALFVVLAVLSFLWSLYPEGTLIEAFSYVQLFIMVWLIWELAPGVQEQMHLMRAYVFGTFVSGIDTVYLFLSHQESVYQRYAGAKLDANDLGLIMALSIPMSYYLLIQNHGRMVWVYRVHLILAGTTILLTASRGATLATVVALAIVPLTQARLGGRQRVALLLTVILLIGGILFLVPETSWERLATVPTEFEQGTFTGRTIIWKAGWEIFRAHPFFGIGANAFRVIVSRELGEPIRMGEADPAPPAHNTFLSVLVEQGVLGFVVFCGMLGALAVSLRGMPPFPQRLWIVSLAVWVVGVSSLTWEMRKPTWFFFGLLMAQCGSIPQMLRDARSYARPRLSAAPSSARIMGIGICAPKPG